MQKVNFSIYSVYVSFMESQKTNSIGKIIKRFAYTHTIFGLSHICPSIQPSTHLILVHAL